MPRQDRKFSAVCYNAVPGTRVWLPDAAVSRPKWSRMRLAASPIHSLACRVAGMRNARVPQVRDRDEEDTAHALLECADIREAAATARTSVRTAFADLPRQAAAVARSAKTCQVLVCGVLPRAPPARSRQQRWARVRPAGAAPEA